MTRRPLTIGLLPVLALLFACGQSASEALDSFPDAKLQTAEDVAAYEVRSSAFGAFWTGQFALGLLKTEAAGAGGCPKITLDGDTLRAEGGCTDDQGVKWFGSAVREGAVAGSAHGKYRLDGYGSERSTDCGGSPRPVRIEFHGTAEISGPSEETVFHLALRADTEAPEAGTCEPKREAYALEYQGTSKGVDGGGQLWNGEGRFGSSVRGVVSAQTTDERFESGGCASEAASGTTTLRAGSDTAVVTYDGATDCDDPPTAQWTLNEAPQGEVRLHSCAATGPGSGWLLPGLAAGFFFVAAGARRRGAPRRDFWRFQRGAAPVPTSSSRATSGGARKRTRGAGRPSVPMPRLTKSTVFPTR